MKQHIKNTANSLLLGNNVTGDNNKATATMTNSLNKKQCGDPYEKKGTTCNLCLILSVLSIIIALIALCNDYPRIIPKENLGLDYIGIIIGILSFLLAILAIMFGYNILEIKKQLRKKIKKALYKIEAFTIDTESKIEELELEISSKGSEIIELKEALAITKIFVKGNIIIKTSDFKYKELIANASEENGLDADIIYQKDLIIDKKTNTPYTKYYATGEICSY